MIGKPREVVHDRCGRLIFFGRVLGHQFHRFRNHQSGETPAGTGPDHLPHFLQPVVGEEHDLSDAGAGHLAHPIFHHALPQCRGQRQRNLLGEKWHPWTFPRTD